MSSAAGGFPDWQRITQWFGSPIAQATGAAIGAGVIDKGPYDVRNFASIVVCVAPVGGNVTVTVTQRVPGGPAGLQVASSFTVVAGNVAFEAFVMLAGEASVHFAGTAGGETLDYAIVPANTNLNAALSTLAQLGFQHNEVAVANETAIDFVDGGNVTFGVMDDPANVRVKVSAAVPAAPGVDGWTALAGAVAYSSADGPTGVITTPSDLTGVIPLGARFSYVQGGGAKYGIVTAIAAGTITVYGGTDYTTAATAITVPRYSLAKAPLGFNTDPRKWTVEATDASDRSQAAPVSGTWYNLGSVSISVPIGVWNVSYQVQASAISNAGANVIADVNTTLSTANNNESDNAWRGGIMIETDATGAQQVIGVIHRSNPIGVTVKTTYFLNAFAAFTTSSIHFRGDAEKTIIRAVCAYL